MFNVRGGVFTISSPSNRGNYKLLHYTILLCCFIAAVIVLLALSVVVTTTIISYNRVHDIVIINYNNDVLRRTII